jgi:hypothetical protein
MESASGAKARLLLREWFDGKISLERLADGGVMAH